MYVEKWYLGEDGILRCGYRMTETKRIIMPEGLVTGALVPRSNPGVIAL